MRANAGILKSGLTIIVAAMPNWQAVSGSKVAGKNKGMVAYCGPGDTVTSFYLIVGERGELW
tara:strand:- start:177 stop:362 length:186 start_codon:yes stop_codon:yes gene_type:complete